MDVAAADAIQHLIPELCREHYQRASSRFERLGLTRGQPGVLRELWQHDGLTQAELGQALHVQPATITRMIQRMERAGWVERRPDPDDQRAWRVYQTDAARTVQPRVESLIQALNAEALQGFTPDEVRALTGFLTRMRDNLRTLNEP
jgi:DNA-binding MarR family transcriptional regulator